MEEGRRLENLSWRLWTRETFCVDHTLNVSPCPSPVIRATNTTAEQNDKDAQDMMDRERMIEENDRKRREQEFAQPFGRMSSMNSVHDGDVPELSSSVDSDGSSDELTMGAGTRGSGARTNTVQIQPRNPNQNMDREGQEPQAAVAAPTTTTRSEISNLRDISNNMTTQQPGDDGSDDEDNETPRPMTSASTSALPSSTSSRAKNQTMSTDRVSPPTTANMSANTSLTSSNTTSNLRRSQTMMTTNTNMSDAAGAAARHGQAGRALYRGRMKHITSQGLEKMVYTIKERKGLEPWLSNGKVRGRSATATETTSSQNKAPAELLEKPAKPQVQIQQPSPRPATGQTVARPSEPEKPPSPARQVDGSESLKRAESSVKVHAIRPQTQRTFSPYDFSAATLRHEAAYLHPSNRTSSSSGSTGLGLGLAPSIDSESEDEDRSEEAIQDCSQTASEAGSMRSARGVPSSRNGSNDSAHRAGVVRGFMPGRISSYTSATQLAPPPPRQTTLPLPNSSGRITTSKSPAIHTAPVSPAAVSANSNQNMLPHAAGSRQQMPAQSERSQASPPKSDIPLKSDGPVRLKPALKSALKRTTTSFAEQDHMRSGGVAGNDLALKGTNHAGSRVRLAPIPVQVVQVPSNDSGESSSSPKIKRIPSHLKNQKQPCQVRMQENVAPQTAKAQSPTDQNAQIDARKKAGMFTLGGSSLEEDNSSYNSYEDRLVSNNAQGQSSQQQQPPPILRRSSGPIGQLRRPGSSDSASGSGSQNVPSPLKNVVFAQDQQVQQAAQAQQQQEQADQRQHAMVQQQHMQQQQQQHTQAQLLAQERERQARLQAEALARQRALVEAQNQQAQAQGTASGSSSTAVSDDEATEAEDDRFESAIDSDSEIDDDSSVIDESDIDDDDEWEDSVDDSASASSSRNGRTPAEDRELFRRVDSRKNLQLASNKSLLTMMMHRPQRVVIPGLNQQDTQPGSSGVTVIPSNPNSKSTPALRRAFTAQPVQLGAQGSQQQTLPQTQGSNTTIAKDVLQQAGGYGDEDAIASSSDESDEENGTLTMRRKSKSNNRQPQPPQAAAPADTNNQHEAQAAAEQQSVSPNATLAPAAIPFALPPRAAMAHSPRTTRRNMLASELTESLRHHLLWERQQKGGGIATMQNSNIPPTANTNLPRRHTTQDVSRLTEYPKPHEGSTAGDDSDSDYLDDFGGEYHNKGW